MQLCFGVTSELTLFTVVEISQNGTINPYKHSIQRIAIQLNGCNFHGKMLYIHGPLVLLLLVVDLRPFNVLLLSKY